MNYPFFKSSWVVGLALWLVVTSVVAQNNLMLSLDIKVTHDPIGSIDPLVFQLVLSNSKRRVRPTHHLSESELKDI